MKAFTAVSLLGAAISPAYAALAPRQSSAAIQPVTVKGNAFYRGSERFYIRGVAYQPGGASDAKDPLLDIDTLKKDIVNFKSLGINTVRIYTIDNSKNHDEGMKLLADAGIYLALDANTPKYSLNRETSATVHRSYNEVYLQSVFATVDAFAEYPNTLLFFSGNEVINEPNNTNTAPYIKAVTRDMKQYIANRHSRIIPVGYSAADVASSIEQQALYFDCGTDDERADFFAFNDYSWCDSASALQTFKGAGWDKKVEMFKDFAKPIFLSEHGCIEDVRRWGEVGALYSTQMSAVYSGGLAYEYTVEPNKFGIVEVKNGQIETNADFDKLKDMYAKTKNPSGDGGAKTNGKAAQCPAQSDDWEVQDTGLPALPVKAQKFMDSGAGTGPGLTGSGSHFAGEASKSTATPGSGNPTRTPNGEAVGSSGGQNAAAVAEIPLRFVAMLAASIVFGAALVF